MTAGDGKVTVPGKSPAVMPSLWSKDGTDGLGTVPSVLEKSRTAHRPQPSDGTVDITVIMIAMISCMPQPHGGTINTLCSVSSLESIFFLVALLLDIILSHILPLCCRKP
jgi:hypothetical protein